MGKRPLMGVVSEAGHTVCWDLHGVVPVAGVGGGVQDANVGANAADYYLLWIHGSQPAF
ncbi:uncharacterized protein METZ01_LOCUS298198 [marine metagenome]|uniref:Uncharacterized protein n=1 Tax=marine metagenome TaxID=408172 RepID=A0A382M8M0_9ZZZZ